MKKSFLLLCFLLFAIKIFGQQFSQYNTGTLYDSFENPSQRSFIPDSSRQLASNFFIPNFGANLYVTGNAQNALINRLFAGYYNTADLNVGTGKYSTVRGTANNYWAMLKIFTSLNGNQEIGFSASTRAEASGHLTDESVAIFNGYLNFPKDSYTNVLNSRYDYQVYHQFSFSYREQVTPRFALGVKLSALLGLTYSKVDIQQSQVNFDRQNDSARINLQGVSRESERLKGFSFKNPGVAISIGAGTITRDGFRLQFNLKDLGVIHWGGDAYSGMFARDTTLGGVSTTKRETNLFNAVTDIISSNKKPGGFYSKTNAIAEISVNRNYWLDYNRHFKFSPTFVASKELYYDGITGALVTPVSYNNYTATFTTSYNTIGLFNFGGQVMYKTPNAEVYLGTERLVQTGRSILTAARNGNDHTQAAGTIRQYSGADIFLGVSFKFGNVIEHPMNASVIPDGEKGFFAKFFGKIFKGKDKNY